MKPDAEDDRQDEAARPVWDGSAQLRDESGTGVDVSARGRIGTLGNPGVFAADLRISTVATRERPTQFASRAFNRFARRVDSARGGRILHSQGSAALGKTPVWRAADIC